MAIPVDAYRLQDPQHIDELRGAVEGSLQNVRPLVSAVQDGDLARFRHGLGCLEAWAEYLDICRASADGFPAEWHSLSRERIDFRLARDYQEAFGQLADELFNQDFSTSTKEHIVVLDTRLLQNVEEFAEGVGKLVGSDEFGQFPSEVTDRGMRILTSLVALRGRLSDRLVRVEILWASVAAAEDARKAKESAAEAQKAAGITGDAALSSFYGELASDEKTSADTFRKITVIMAFLGAVATAMFVMGPSVGLAWLDIPAGDYVHLIQRAVFVAGVFGLAGYFARQAHQHRSMANWASALSVQLKTFDAYLRAIENAEVKDDLRKTFGARVFGDHPVMKGEPSVTPSAAAMDTAVGWAAKLTAGGK